VHLQRRWCALARILHLSVIAQICRLLDGLPRSIELAAALTVRHSCRAIVELVAPASRYGKAHRRHPL
jgi:hypothetical protein